MSFIFLLSCSETYQFFDLLFCCPDQVTEIRETLREVLNGDRLTNSLYQLKFREDKTMEMICWKLLKRKDIAQFRYSNKDEEAEKEEVGWKHLHGDVFRYPPYLSLFCAIMGSGAQLLKL
ncbi:Transmembrane 9 superfamily member [Thalictrum thalictroides]|uniref:Transmembrane 9 superfamily member n=1 Tax=Thalictrum thalictroides TaxID=46969 RepID=A0A7J6WW31_THATH|nr:Transmembrane 9 superfamily member [Thalictrum thalictroides]